jgi:hypothetical protein
MLYLDSMANIATPLPKQKKKKEKKRKEEEEEDCKLFFLDGFRSNFRKLSIPKLRFNRDLKIVIFI